MVTFVSLFLGLVTGSQTVEVTTTEDVAWVEILLDEVSVARIEPPESSTEVQFGDALLPHVLEAVAFDEDGRELSRDRQIVNLPRPGAEAEILILRGDQGEPQTAKLVWDSIHGDPVASSVVLDSRTIAHDTLDRIELGRLRDGELHHLEIELLFEGGLRLPIQRSFGLESEEVGTRLTAYPARVTGKPKRKLDLEDASSWLFEGEEPLHVEAIESDRAELVFVRDSRTLQFLEDLARQMGAVNLTNPLPMALRPQDRLRFLGSRTRPATERSRGAYDVFDISRAFTSNDNDLYWLLAGRENLRAGPQRLADAVATAAVAASSTRQSRAVVLIIGGSPEDESRWSVDTVRGYLEAIHVPLVVWQLRRPRTTPTGGPALPTVETEWGRAANISSPRSLYNAGAALGELLERQRILWVSGLRLPSRIRVAQGAPIEALR